MIRFSQCLREVIASSCGNQKELAKKAGVSETNVSRWLTGGSHPKSQILGQLILALPEPEGARIAAAWAQDRLPKIAQELVMTVPRNPSSKVMETSERWPEELNDASRRKFMDFARIAVDYPDVMNIVDVLHGAAMRMASKTGRVE